MGKEKTMQKLSTFFKETMKRIYKWLQKSAEIWLLTSKPQTSKETILGAKPKSMSRRTAIVNCSQHVTFPNCVISSVKAIPESLI